MRADLLQDRMREKELLEAQLANLETEIETIEAEAEEAKVLVEKIPSGFSFGFKGDNNTERLAVHLTEEETKDMVKQILADVDDFSFVLAPFNKEMQDVVKDFNKIFSTPFGGGFLNLIK